MPETFVLGARQAVHMRPNPFEIVEMPSSHRVPISVAQRFESSQGLPPRVLYYVEFLDAQVHFEDIDDIFSNVDKLFVV